MIQRNIIKHAGAKIDNYTITIAGKELKYSIQEPTFKQLLEAISITMKMTGDLHLAKGGKIIWDLCCLECDAEIENDKRVLLGICIELCIEYVLPAQSDIKKN